MTPTKRLDGPARRAEVLFRLWS